MDFTKLSRKCLPSTIAIKTIFQNFIKIQVKHFVINSQDFIDLWQHHKKFVTKKCDYVCPKNEPCYLHKRLNELTDFVDFLRDFNLNDNDYFKNCTYI